MPELAPRGEWNAPGTGVPVAGRVFAAASSFLQLSTTILQHLEPDTNMRKLLGRGLVTGILLVSMAHRAASAQASAAIQASVRVVDPASSAYPVAAIQLALNPRLSARQPLRRDLRGATVLVELPAQPAGAPARRVTFIHW
jgi:hypothetical protein